ncbi:FemAB family protein [Psychroserpens ponticola]|uniref:FemAB family protein n=1 Tax=Psychroserpens ponticola TaxID=2932268 RepID=A0ABY7RUN4_9FLAO|nr:FemAB family protein [Psychroserpens ponticola]WCO00836.1 FemAB family protein [Psychroserpens ponticola]
MYKYSVKVYHSDFKKQWDEFVTHSKNATFLFQRDFMDYHKDRFKDYSLMVYDGEQLLAIFPANISNDIVYSHQGLTYGGLFFDERLTSTQIQEIFELVLAFFKTKNIQSVIVKSLPEFYQFHSSRVIDDLYKQDHSSIVKENIILAIDYNQDFKIAKSKIKRFKKLQRNQLTIKEGKLEINAFWNTILLKRLAEKHNSKPVHNLLEIQYLHSKFEDEITQYNIYREEEILAGITIFKKGNIVKSQYGMASIEGEKLNALDMLFVSLIIKFKEEGMQYFTMGSVNDNSELGYSKGMLKQKEELGCRKYTQNIWKIELND